MNFKEEFKIVGFFYILSAIFWISIGIMGAYWILYFAEMGLTYSLIALIFIMVPIASLIFEIPTGAIADIFGRKVSVFISYLFTGLAYIGIILSGTNVFLLMILYFILGIAYTFESGALESWFVDTIKHEKKQKYMHRFFGRWGSISSIGFVIGPFIGGLLVKKGIATAFWTTAIIMLFLSFFVLVFCKEPYFKRKKVMLNKDLKETIVTAKIGFKHIFSQKIILVLTLITVLLTFANQMSYNAYQPFVVKRGLPIEYLGFALSIAGFISIFSLNYSHKIAKYLGGNRKSLLVFTFLFGLAILGVAFFKYLPILFISLIGYTAFAEFTGLSGTSAPAFKELYNKFVPSKIRATVISSTSFFMKIGEILGLLSFGLISSYIGLQAGIIFAGCIIILISFIYLKIRVRR